ncbi:MAG: hypothetical protein GC160_18755 [Acidobacteria bacterium]|nr:hypothetical protein [Acidobacteriota bacterium]
MKRFWMAAALAACAAGCGSTVESASVSEPAGGPPTGLWTDATAETIGETGDWSNKVDLADLDGDGDVDLLFANGGNYREPGDPVASTVFLNEGPGKPFRDATAEIFGSEPMLVRVIKTADVDADGHIDIFFGATYQTQSRLLLGKGGGAFEDVTKTHLPQTPLSLGDAEFGDADLDGDLDVVLADWGADNPMKNEGGRVRLFLNDGQGRFTDATDAMMPETLVRFSWDLELADVDNDADLDLMISSKLSDGSFLYENDGKGKFTDVTDGRMPQYTNNYEFEPMDLNGDGYVDTGTINDGGKIEGQRGSHRENIFLNDGKGGFVYATPTSLPDTDNLGYDDNRVVYLDFDNDGDADILLGSLSGPDRLLINDGKAVFTVAPDVLTGPETKGTLDIALADLNGDHKLDIVMAQGEVKGHIAEKIFFGDKLAADTAAPKVQPLKNEGGVVRARVHDNKAPVRGFDFESVSLVAGDRKIPMTWYGESLWTATAPAGATGLKVCAVDKAGNEGCADVE